VNTKTIEDEGAQNHTTHEIQLINQLAFQVGSHFYPLSIKKRVHSKGETVYTVEMNVGQNDLIICDASTLENALIRLAELVGHAVETRNLQKKRSNQAEKKE
jgi:hypothetical protein